jgi:hypothetical protein
MQRRDFISGTIGLFGLGFGCGVLAQGTPMEDLKPGEFTWHPERSPSGPVAVIVSIPQQLVHVYRNGIRIAVSTCSTGKPGHATPTGVFVVLQKDRNHHSSTYNDAPMPNMNRLTWSGIALHAGQLPGYPASHGCVRLPMDFSADLFEVTHLGTPVIIAGAASDPWELTHPGLVLGGYADTEFVDIQSGLAGKKAPQDWSDAEAQPVTSLIASTADKKALLLINEEIIAEGTLTVAGGSPLGEHVLILQGADQATSGMHWAVITHTKDDGPLAPAPDDLIRRLTVDPAFTTAMSQHLHPGMIAVLTDLPLTPDTRTGGDFVVMNSDDGTGV